jgi:hypothetical protein
LTSTIAIELRPSRSLVAFLVAGHVLAICAAFSALPPVAGAIVLGALALSLLVQLQAALLRKPGALIALHINVDGTVRCRSRSGDWHSVEIGRQTYASPWLVVLRLAGFPDGVCRVVLLPDSADAEALRRLRAWLQWGREAQPRRDARLEQ